VKRIEPVPASEASLPRTSGGFRMIREIGRGGMGVVYEAEELSSGRTVALKVLAAELAVSGEAFERFRREARTAAAISDSRCVFVYGAHEVDGSPAIAMELCGGETLEHRLSRNEPVPIETAVRWTLEMLEGLAAAHAAGVIHRDLKPSNCFTTEDGHVKIGDFGLARSLERDVRLTQSGAFLGSPLYASPEQIRGRDVDVRSDLYSCGATLYALLTGRAPYGGANVGEVLARILSEPPLVPRSIRADIPRGLERVVLRAMERDPAKRFKDHASFRDALQPFAVSSSAPAGLVRRFLAHMIDSATLSVVNFLTLTWLTGLKLSIVELDPAHPGMYRSGAFQLMLTLQMALYFALLEGLLGASLGKWLVGQRVVTVVGNQTSLPRAALRTLVFFVATSGAVHLAYVLRTDAITFSTFTLVGSAVGYTALWSPMRKRNGWRGLHDFASGMRVVQTSSPFARLRPVEAPISASLAISREWPATLGGYRIEGIVAVNPSGALLQAHDPELGRSVWIQARDDPNDAADDARRALSRAARLRWLDRLECDGRTFDVFEAPGGASVRACLERINGLDWSTMLRFFGSLAEELAALEHRGGAKPPQSLDQLWVDRSWTLRVLDERLERASETTDRAARTPITLIEELAQLMLPTDGRTKPRLPPDLPGHAEPIARRLFGLAESFESPTELRAALAELARRPDALAFKTRAGQIALAASFPLFGALVAFAAVQVSSRVAGGSVYAFTFARELAEDAHPKLRTPDHPPLSADDRRAREILLARALENPWSKTIEEEASADELQAMREATKLHPLTSDDEIEWAKSQMAASAALDPNPFRHPFDDPLRAVAIFAASASAIWAAFALIFALAFRGGMSLRVLSVLVRDRIGERASRPRCAVRALAAGVPLVIAYAIPVFALYHRAPTAAVAAFALAALCHAAWIAHALQRPTRSLQDRVARTSLAPC